MPVPSAITRLPISWLPSIRSKRARSTFRILPRRGRMACVRRSRPVCAEPPAESPSTRNSSVLEASFSEQSFSLAALNDTSIAVLRRVSSRALRAASRAMAASMILPVICLASVGFSSNHSPSFSFISDSTAGRTSDETSLSLVWLENFGSGTFTDRTAVRPSRASSPVKLIFSRFAIPLSCAYFCNWRVSAPRKPARWVPPSRCGMLLVKGRTFSW